MPMMDVVRAALPFLAVLFVFLIMVTYIPAISTYLGMAVVAASGVFLVWDQAHTPPIKAARAVALGGEGA